MGTDQSQERCEQLKFEQVKCVQFNKMLKELAVAKDYSLDLNITPWEFAMTFEQLRDFSVTENDLKWLMAKGWLLSDQKSSSRQLARRLDPQTRFIIAERGLEVLCLHDSFTEANVDVSMTANSDHDDLPQWDDLRKELKYHGKVVKRFRWPAPNQEIIIGVFTEEGWPPRIVDPLPPESGLDPKRRLGDTIKGLNRNHENTIMRFRGDGTGEGVLWDVTSGLLKPK